VINSNKPEHKDQKSSVGPEAGASCEVTAASPAMPMVEK